MSYLIAVPVAACVLALPAIAQQSGDLDLTFSNDGIVTTHTQSGAREYGRCVAVQPDGRIVVGGSIQQQGVGGRSMLLARYLPDGTLDGSFGSGGIVTLIIGGQTEGEHGINGIALQPDGKIVAVGYSQVVGIGFHSAILRFNTNGTLDNTFSGDGIRLDDVVPDFDAYRDVAIQPNGRIVANGYAATSTTYDVVVARYLANGTLDNSFSTDGFVLTDIGGVENYSYEVVLQPDGKIVVGGGGGEISGPQHFLLARYTANGVLDAAFGNGGIVTSNFSTYTDYANALAIQPDGKLLAGGYISAGIAGNMAVVRYMSDGMLDASFGTGGVATFEHGMGSMVYSMVLLPDGRIALGGGSGGQIAAAMLLPDGTLDTGFSDDGLVALQLGTISGGNAAALQPDGKLILAGTRAGFSSLDDLVVLRYHTATVVGIEEGMIHGAALRIFPNPAEELLNVQVDAHGAVLEIRSADGRLVRAQRTTSTTVVLDIADLESGMYVICAQEGSGRKSAGRFVKR
ncbi:MAG: T9SS type A sorting domain-containing protein [Flavobacteriales bacterium]|nr:T9SS type A sorting domain-containing protein [Flavobacteriales bacterium]